jgi:hypothetical protein
MKKESTLLAFFEVINEKKCPLFSGEDRDILLQ